jgi:hypothetical protein
MHDILQPACAHTATSLQYHTAAARHTALRAPTCTLRPAKGPASLVKLPASSTGLSSSSPYLRPTL